MVEIKAKIKKHHEPRKPRKQPYKQVNAYTQSPSKQQIITLLVFVILLVLHQVFVTPQVIDADVTLMWILFGFRYFLLIVIGYDYVLLTVRDPVDRIILDQKYICKFKQQELRNCSLCVSFVQKSSHHCMSCDRCTEDFDHHCKYLNNCIGARNYEYFFRILIIFCLYTLVTMGLCIWVVAYHESEEEIISIEFRKWIIVGLIIVNGILFALVLSLLGFHIYISCCVNMSTLQYIYQDPVPKPRSTNPVIVQHAPLSAEHFTKTLQNRQINQQVGQNQTKGKQFTQPMEYYRK